MQTGTTEPRTDPRVARTRKLIEGAFLTAMKDKGFEQLTVQDVASRAGINRVTFYSHFDDKYDLLTFWIRGSLEAEIQRRELYSRRLSEDSVAELFRLVCEYVVSAQEHCKPPHEQLNWLLETEIKRLAAEVIEEWLERDHEDVSNSKGCDRLAAVAAGAAMFGLVEQWMRTGNREPAADFIDSSKPFVTAILGIYPGDATPEPDCASHSVVRR